MCYRGNWIARELAFCSRGPAWPGSSRGALLLLLLLVGVTWEGKGVLMILMVMPYTRVISLVLLAIMMMTVLISIVIKTIIMIKEQQQY